LESSSPSSSPYPAESPTPSPTAFPQNLNPSRTASSPRPSGNLGWNEREAEIDEAPAATELGGILGAPVFVGTNPVGAVSQVTRNGSGRFRLRIVGLSYLGSAIKRAQYRVQRQRNVGPA
jgi:hypothetical protein